MSSLNLATAAMSTVAAMAAMKSNQSRGSLLPTADISRFITPNANVLSHLLPQAVGTESMTLSALYSSHAPAINRIFQQDGVSPKRQRSRERHRSPSSHYSSGGHRSDSDYRRSRYERRDYRQSEESSSYRYRSRLGGGDTKDDSLLLTVMFLFFLVSGLLPSECGVHIWKNVTNIAAISNSLPCGSSHYYYHCVFRVSFIIAASLCTVSALNCLSLPVTFPFRLLTVLICLINQCLSMKLVMFYVYNNFIYRC